ncbi:MAG: TIGR00296 family protein [Desulfurococcaceae archaeon]
MAIHPSDLSFEEGILLVKFARKAIENYLKRGERLNVAVFSNEKLKKPGMVFTTLEIVDPLTNRTSLRGCIGFLAPVHSLIESVVESAIEAATGDPRFPPVRLDEMDKIIVEVTVLSEPVELNVANRVDLPRHINVGRHGLLVEKGWFKGTLLPIVPVDYCWDQETFLAETCIKAGLRPDCWLDPSTKVYYYEGRAFREKAPRGEIYERDMEKEFAELCEMQQQS